MPCRCRIVVPLVGAAIRVDADVHGLAEAHVGQLRFLEISCHPSVERNHNHDRLRRGRQIAHRRGQPCNAAVDRRAQLRPAQIRVRASLLGNVLIALRCRHLLLGLQHFYLSFGRRFRGQRRIERRAPALQVGCGLLSALNGSGASLSEILIARVLFLGEREGRLSLRHLVARLSDLVLLLRNLCVQIRHRSFGLFYLSRRLIDRGLIVARINFRQQISRLHDLIVGHVHGDDVAGDLRTD